MCQIGERLFTANVSLVGHLTVPQHTKSNRGRYFCRVRLTEKMYVEYLIDPIASGRKDTLLENAESVVDGILKNLNERLAPRIHSNQNGCTLFPKLLFPQFDSKNHHPRRRFADQNRPCRIFRIAFRWIGAERESGGNRFCAQPARHPEFIQAGRNVRLSHKQFLHAAQSDGKLLHANQCHRRALRCGRPGWVFDKMRLSRLSTW